MMLQLVDESGKTIGTVAKLAAHEHGGRLHRAISVVLFDRDGRILIQKRAASKYHFAGKWANAACSHPVQGESLERAGRRALGQELGISTAIHEVARFTYLAHDPRSDLTEHEYDHILVGTWSYAVLPNPVEVEEVRWLNGEEVREWLNAKPHEFADWFGKILSELSSLPDEAREANEGLNLFLNQFAKKLE